MLRVASQSLVTIEQVRAADNCGCVTDDYPTDEVLQRIIDQASDNLSVVTGGALSGRQNVIARPCRTGMECSCVCCDLDAIPLGDERPVVTAVKINGVNLTPDQWWMHWNGVSWMIALLPTGDQTWPPNWPSWQHRWRPDTADQTFAIYYTQGIDVDSYDFEAAALEVICDMIGQARFSADALNGITSITIGGTTATVDDNWLERIMNGGIGPLTRRLLGLYASGGGSRSMVWSPELDFGWDLGLVMNPA